MVKIYLPAIEAQGIETSVVLKQGIEQFKGEGTILAIEDEETVLSIDRQMLERLVLEWGTSIKL